jgi:Fe2+ or Zn2+ uptake regulation protein
LKIICNWHWSIAIELQQRLRKKGLKLTPQRVTVFDVLRENEGRPISADQIYSACIQKNPRLSLTTVYRTIELFCDIGVATHVHMHEPAQFYELNTDTHHHHVVCIACGLVEPIDVCMVDQMNDLIRDNQDFVVTSHCLSLFGYCPKCLPKSS